MSATHHEHGRDARATGTPTRESVPAPTTVKSIVRIEALRAVSKMADGAEELRDRMAELAALIKPGNPGHAACVQAGAFVANTLATLEGVRKDVMGAGRE